MRGKLLTEPGEPLALEEIPPTGRSARQLRVRVGVCRVAGPTSRGRDPSSGTPIWGVPPVLPIAPVGSRLAQN